jgi:hypothetical protein
MQNPNAGRVPNPACVGVIPIYNSPTKSSTADTIFARSVPASENEMTFIISLRCNCS